MTAATKREATTAAGCRVAVLTLPTGDVAVTVHSANDGTTHTFACRTADLPALAALFTPEPPR